MLNDLQALVAAVDANDAAAARKADAALTADAATLDKYDWKSVDAASKALFQPLIDAYNRDMKIAAGN